MKAIAIAFAIAGALALGGCETMQMVAPNTTAGFEENGIVGALDGASGAVVLGCQSLDNMRLAVDGLAVATGTSDEVDDVRAARMQACAVAQAVQAVGVAAAAATGAPTGDPAPVTVHRN